jgi:Na+/H+ antiporter NhaC
MRPEPGNRVRLRLFGRVLLCLLTAGVLSAPAAWAAVHDISVHGEGAALSGSPLHLSVTLGPGVTGTSLPGRILVDGVERASRELTTGTQVLRLDEVDLAPGHHTVTVITAEGTGTTSVRTVPGWLSIVPPLIAIGLALIFKDVLISLFVGVLSGALILNFGHPVRAFARSIDQFIVGSLANSDHASIIIFTCLLGGMVGVINRSGGTYGIVERLRGYATNVRRGQVATWVMGVLIFFDDYANTLIVGSTMRPITDRLKVSREKLAYIVDSTAAPVASVIPISTWIGFEVGLIAAAFNDLHLPFNAYSTFIASIPFRFYPIFALIFGFAIAFSGRDFGPMLRAERRASRTGKLLADDAMPLADFTDEAQTPPDGIPLRAVNAVLPILTVVGVTVAGLWITGSAVVSRTDYASTFKWIQDVFSNASSFRSLLWGSLAGLTVALVAATVQRLLTIRQSMEAVISGFKAMLLALVVLVLAWSIGAVCSELHTADFVVGLTRDVLSPHWLPVLTFAISAAVSFATGTSWGTMAILMPLVIPIANGLSLHAGFQITEPLYYTHMVGTISSVLAGSVWGDHCSPISDTTIMSSMASGCDHIAHVRTQIPYALGVGVLGMLVGDIPTAYGVSPWLSIGVGAIVMVAVVRWLGKRDD